jgi:soluble P-type ATPase
VPLTVSIPGRPLELDYLLFDLNGTLTDRGRLIEGVPERLAPLANHVTIQLLSADTFGALAETPAALDLEPRRIASGADKRRAVEELGPSECAAVGNGLNDVPMLEAAALAIAVMGPEGASPRALAAADIVCRTIIEALDLLLDGRRAHRHPAP